MYTLLLSHAERFQDVPNPGHTPKGLEMLAEMNRYLRETYQSAFDERFFVSSGTGLRFLELAEHACANICRGAVIVRHYTPLLGGPEADRKDKRRDLASGEVIPADQWLGIGSGLVNPWELIARLGTLADDAACNVLVLCAGGEFTSSVLKSLKIKNRDFPKAEGSIYRLDTHPRGITKLFTAGIDK